MTVPSVQITVADNGTETALLLPQQNIQVKIGVAQSGTLYQPVATASLSTLLSTFVGGPLVESSGMVANAGGIVIAMRVPVVTHGTAQTPVAAGTGTAISGGAIAVAVDGTNGAFDDYYVRFLCVTGGTLSNSGSSGVQFQISLDAGRNYSPVITLANNALTYAIPGTGLTLTLGTNGQTYVKGDTIQFQTIAPLWSAAGVQTALAAFAASQYALAGVGSMHLVGVSSSSDAANEQIYLDALFAQFIFNRLIIEARDALAPVAWGGSGETEATWINSLGTAFSATSAKRVCCGAGHYNMPSVFPNPTYGVAYSYRRPCAWADAVRRVRVPPQRRGGRVRDGSLSNIVVNPATDPADGFIYHDERVTPGLDAARFMSLMTWPKKQGFYVCQERLMSPVGSQFTELVLGNVIDIACAIGYETGVDEISDDLRTNQNGTLYANDALTLQGGILAAIDDNMTDAAMISDATVTVDQGANVQSTRKIPITISVLPRGYVDTISETIGLAVPTAAPVGG